MKQKITIEQNGKTVFKGKIMNMPIKQAHLIEKSVELFDDDDPCIIHTSYVVQHFTTVVLDVFAQTHTRMIDASKYTETLDFLDVETLVGLTITLK